MPVSVILGLQWGDEGKGKICDLLAEGHELILRYQGGANAGHTVYHAGQKVVLHLIPSGILRPGVTNLVGPGVVMDLDALQAEMEMLDRLGQAPAPRRLVIDQACPVVHALHKEIDRRSCGAIGTTGRGIGPAYEDLVARRALRLNDLGSLDRIRRQLHLQLEARGLDGELGGRVEELAVALHVQRRMLEPFLGDVPALLDQALRAGRRVLAEGAQGTMLDVFVGTYPFVTSSITTLGGLFAYTGVSPRELDRVYGVFKAYLTRVGNGPFPTELFDRTGEVLREAGHEFGATTGRPRRCGWLDLPLLEFACRVNGVTDLIMTKVDVLAAVPEGFKVATTYEDRGCIPWHLEEALPVYTQLPAVALPPLDKLDRAAMEEAPGVSDLVSRVERSTGVPVRWVSVGPNREDVRLR
jgi:adenylosuccinate synthase